MRQRIKGILGRLEKERGAALFAALLLVSAGAVVSVPWLKGLRAGAGVPGGEIARVARVNGLKFSGALSQTKFVKGESGEAFLTLTVETPEMPSAAVQRAADTVVVLDRSGSMASDNRLPYAKRAIHDLIERMSSDDRFALVVFDSTSQVLEGLSPLTGERKQRLYSLVEGIRPGSGTNMSAGIELARSLLSGRSSERAQKVILLSDGEANEGITNAAELGKMASSINKQSASVSTIGMGLGFNEQLMASLADWGGGNFSYLEHLEKLAEILNQNLEDTRQTFAANSSIEMSLRSGVALKDAGGYPFEQSGSVVKIPLGQLLSGSHKRLTFTMALSTGVIERYELGAIKLRYANGSEDTLLSLPGSGLQVAVLEPSMRHEVLASVNKGIAKDVWQYNNLGVAQTRMQKALASGDLEGARGEIMEYRQKLAVAEASAGMPLASPGLYDELSKMEADLDDAGSGSASEQAEKKNRLGKRYLKGGRDLQRQ